MCEMRKSWGCEGRLLVSGRKADDDELAFDVLAVLVDGVGCGGMLVEVG